MQPAIVTETTRRIIPLKAPRNPELEEIRDEVLSQKVNDIEKVSQLKEQLRQIHAAYLFTGSGKNVLASICTVISSTPPTPYFSSWKDLASYLGLSDLQIRCIEQYNFDHTEIVLKAYSQHWESTLDVIISALQYINRYDAIGEAENGLQDLAKIARQQQIKRTEDVNNAITMFGKGTSDGILRPDFVPSLSYQLPITLNKNFMTFYEEAALTKNIKHEMTLQNSCPDRKKKEKKFCKAVMLTFGADGEEIARRVAKEFRKPRERYLPIGVLLLEEHFDKVQENPEQFIAHIFPQMHYIIPILTIGYLQSLSNGSPYHGSSFSSTDSQHVKFIHDLMMKEYVGKNGCKNKRVRCIIPDNQLQAVLSHKHMILDPVLQVWEKESEIEKLACRILKTRKIINN